MVRKCPSNIPKIVFSCLIRQRDHSPINCPRQLLGVPATPGSVSGIRRYRPRPQSRHLVECLGILGTKNGCPTIHGRFKQAKMMSEAFFMDQNVERSNIELGKWVSCFVVPFGYLTVCHGKIHQFLRTVNHLYFYGPSILYHSYIK